MMDAWVWTKGKHSRPLKTIRFELDHFPTEQECDSIFFKNEDIKFYVDHEIAVTYNNVHEYQL